MEDKEKIEVNEVNELPFGITEEELENQEEINEDNGGVIDDTNNDK